MMFVQAKDNECVYGCRRDARGWKVESSFEFRDTLAEFRGPWAKQPAADDFEHTYKEDVNTWHNNDMIQNWMLFSHGGTDSWIPHESGSLSRN
jgi:hypothetical protein